MVLYLKEQFYNYVKSYRDFAEKMDFNTFFKILYYAQTVSDSVFFVLK